MSEVTMVTLLDKAQRAHNAGLTHLCEFKVSPQAFDRMAEYAPDVSTMRLYTKQGIVSIVPDNTVSGNTVVYVYGDRDYGTTVEGESRSDVRCEPIESIKTVRSEAAELAKLVEEKQAAYGDSFGRSQEVLRVLYPQGISTEQLADALTVVRVLDKLFRIATRKDAFGESPWRDIAGYALLSVVRDAKMPKLSK